MYHQFNIQQFYVLPTQCNYVFCVDLRTNSHYFPIQHYLTGFYNQDEVFTARYGLGDCFCSYKTLYFAFHTVHFLHCKSFTNPYRTNKSTIPFIYISLLINRYISRLNCNHHLANSYITKPYSNKTVSQRLRMSRDTHTA